MPADPTVPTPLPTTGPAAGQSPGLTVASSPGPTAGPTTAPTTAPTIARTAGRGGAPAEVSAKTASGSAGRQTARPVGPVAQFALLLVPIVMSCFFLVYALMGWVIEGRDKLNWSLEAVGVAFWVGLGIPAYALLTIAWTRLMGGPWRHPLIVSGAFHAVLAAVLALSIVIATRS